MGVDANEWAALTHGYWVGEPPREWRGAALDSRKIEAGNLFIALPGARVDGHTFLSAAEERGAAAALVSQPNHDLKLPQLVVENVARALQTLGRAQRRAFRGPVIGLTGSCGKTTTKNLLAQFLATQFSVRATEGNLNNTLGVPLTLLGLENDRHSAAVIETGINQIGEMHLLSRMVEPTEVVLTGIAPVHIERLGDLETIAREKLQLGQAGRGAVPVTLPRATAPLAAVAAYPGEKFWLGTGQDPTDDFSWQMRWSGGATLLHWEDRRSGRETSRELELPLLSRGMVANVALALSVVRRLEVDLEPVVATLRDWQPMGMRGEVLYRGENPVYLDCYNANPAAMMDALEFFQEVLAVRPGPRFFVLGGMGELGEAAEVWHREVIRSLELRSADQFALVGEEAATMADELRVRGLPPERQRICAQAGELKEELGAFTGAVFLKGSRRYHLEEALPEDRPNWICGEKASC